MKHRCTSKEQKLMRCNHGGSEQLAIWQSHCHEKHNPDVASRAVQSGHEWQQETSVVAADALVERGRRPTTPGSRQPDLYSKF
jgi:hypothetical protein